jgi:sigma-54 dependent transcriptional regulator, acetoin dehydrogenase operon transcriptional activator AcoR
MEDLHKTREELMGELEKVSSQPLELQEPQAEPVLRADVLQQSGTGPAAVQSVERPSRREAREHDLCGEARKSDQFYRILLDASPDPIVVYDIDGIPKYINSAFTQLFGWTFEELQGKRIDFVPRENWGETNEMISKVLKGEGFLNRETRRYAKDGRVVDVSVSGAVFFDENGRAAGSVIHLQEITERKRAERKIRQHNEFLQTVLESLTHPFYVIDAKDYTVIMANSAAGPNWSGATCYSLTHASNEPCGRASEHVCPLEEIKRSKKPALVEHIHVDQHGNLRNIEIHAYPIVDHENRVTRMIEYSTDITDRKRAEHALQRAYDELEIRVAERTSELEEINQSLLHEIAERKSMAEELRQSEERFRTIFESAQDFIFLKDLSLRYTHVNPAMERLFDLPASEIIGKTYQNLFPEEDSAYIKEVDTRVLAGQLIEHEYTRRVKGVAMTFHEIRVPMRDSSGKITGMCGISRDVTRRKKIGQVRDTPVKHYPSDAMRITLEEADHAAGGESIVLLLGESGSGKDHWARWIHERSRRASGPFFALNCAAISKELAESELFGHEPGAFTGARSAKRGLLELAEGGTLLLNEIGELSLSLQSKLLTFLDTKSFLRVGGQKPIHVNARLMAATNRHLEKEIAEGRFLQALFYRLNVLAINVPPLRERIEDIPILLEEIMAMLVTELQFSQIPVIEPSDVINLVRYRWPGNVRELRNVLERALMLWDGERLKLRLPSVTPTKDHEVTETRTRSRRTLREITDEVTQRLCTHALVQCGGNKTAAARLLGISRDSFYRYIERFGIHQDILP